MIHKVIAKRLGDFVAFHNTHAFFMEYFEIKKTFLKLLSTYKMKATAKGKA